VKKQLQRLQEQRKLSDPWGFCREMSMGYRRFHQTTTHNDNSHNSSPSYRHRPSSHDSTESVSATGAGYRGAKTLKSTTNVLAFSDDEDDTPGTGASHLLSTHANELVMGSMPSKNFVAVKSSSNLTSDYCSSSRSSPLSSFFNPPMSGNNSLTRRHSNDLHFDDYEDDEEEGEGDDLWNVKPVRISSKFPSPTKPKLSGGAGGDDFEKLFCPRDPNKKPMPPSAAAAAVAREEDESRAFRRVQTADGNLSERSRLRQDHTKPIRSSANSPSVPSSSISLAINHPPHRFRSTAASPTSISDKISPVSTSRGGAGGDHPSPVTRPTKIPKKIKVTGTGASPSPSLHQKSVDPVEEFDALSRPVSPQEAALLHAEDPRHKTKKPISKSHERKSLANHRQLQSSGFTSSSTKRVGVI
jgi:hypothetical protein